MTSDTTAIIYCILSIITKTNVSKIDLFEFHLTITDTAIFFQTYLQLFFCK